jgi:cell division protease FtsH
MQWSFGYVKFADPAHKYIHTVDFYLDQLCVALGAREAERLLLPSLSLGAAADLQSATAIARELVEIHGLLGEGIGPVQYLDMKSGQRRKDLADATRYELDQRVAKVVEEQRARAERIIRDHQDGLVTLRDLLLKEKTLDGATLGRNLRTHGKGKG